MQQRTNIARKRIIDDNYREDLLFDVFWNASRIDVDPDPYVSALLETSLFRIQETKIDDNLSKSAKNMY